VSFFTSCGKDGLDGDSYISFEWDWYVDSYTDDNSSTPSTINENTYYQVYPGTYYFSYECSDLDGNFWGFDGSYHIYINEGEPGSFLTDGDNGKDNYFTLSLSGSGYDFYNKNTPEKKDSLNDSCCIDFTQYEKVYFDSVYHETYYSHNLKMDVIKRMFKLVKK